MCNGLVAASRTVHVIVLGVYRVTLVWVGLTNFYHVFIAVIAVGMVKLAIDQVVEMIAVTYGGMSTMAVMGMAVMRMGF